jgi:hypothetical protein
MTHPENKKIQHINTRNYKLPTNEDGFGGRGFNCLR